MKALLKYVFIFCLGVLSTALVVDFRAERKRKRSREDTLVRWRVSVPTMTEAYYHPRISVPLPRDLDFSSNTWRQLTFWQNFARSYELMRPENASRSTRLVAVAFPFDEPFWIETQDSWNASEFARMAFCKAEEGMTDEQLVDWVTEKYKSIEWLHYEQDYSGWFPNMVDDISNKHSEDLH